MLLSEQQANRNSLLLVINLTVGHAVEDVLRQNAKCLQDATAWSQNRRAALIKVNCCGHYMGNAKSKSQKMIGIDHYGGIEIMRTPVLKGSTRQGILHLEERWFM